MPSYVFSFRTKVDRQITAEQESAWPQWFQEIGASVLDFGHRVLRLSYRRAAELFEQHTGVGPFISSGTRHSPMRPKRGPHLDPSQLLGATPRLPACLGMPGSPPSGSRAGKRTVIPPPAGVDRAVSFGSPLLRCSRQAKEGVRALTHPRTAVDDSARHRIVHPANPAATRAEAATNAARNR